MNEAPISRDMVARLNWVMGHLTSPQPSGRFMTSGLSFIQRVGMGGVVKLWSPTDKEGQFISDKFKGVPYDWSIVRQIEIFQENANNLMDRLDINNMWDMYKSFALMRAGGLRVVVIAAGHYDRTTESNVGEFDANFQDKLRKMEHTLWLEDFNKNSRQQLKESPIKVEEFLPHVYTAVSAENLIGRKNRAYYEQAGSFMEKVRQIPMRQQAIDYDINVGLRTPKNANNNVQTFQMLPENTYMAIMPFLRSFFGTFGASVQPPVMHMRSYGDHVRGKPIMSNRPTRALHDRRKVMTSIWPSPELG